MFIGLQQVDNYLVGVGTASPEYIRERIVFFSPNSGHQFSGSCTYKIDFNAGTVLKLLDDRISPVSSMRVIQRQFIGDGFSLRLCSREETAFFIFVLLFWIIRDDLMIV
jgi:hypothetical protein